MTAQQIIILLVPGAIALVAWLLRLTVFDRVKALEDALKDSAKAQGTRIGNLESWQFAMEREALAIRRVRREIAAEQSRGVVSHQVGDEDSKT